MPAFPDLPTDSGSDAIESELEVDHQWILDGELLMGDNTPYVFMSAEGFDLPPMRVEDVMRPLGHGQFAFGQDYFAGRTVRLTFGINDDYGSATLQDRVDALKAKMAPRSDTMVMGYRYNNVDARRIYVRPRRCNFDLDDLMRFGIPTVSLEFLAPDPRIYSDVLYTSSTPSGSSSGGLGFPHGFPHGFGSSTGGSLNAVNEGNFPTPVSGRVTANTGGITSFVLLNTASEEEFSMTVTLAAGEYIDFDFDAKTVLYAGTSSRIDDVDRPDSVWFPLYPGSNPIQFNSSGSGTATLELNWRSAWL